MLNANGLPLLLLLLLLLLAAPKEPVLPAELKQPAAAGPPNAGTAGAGAAPKPEVAPPSVAPPKVAADCSAPPKVVGTDEDASTEASCGTSMEASCDTC